MATKVVMEALSPTMEEGRLVEWKKQEGDPVAVGDVLADVETDKAVMELVARAEGTLLKQVAAAGATIPVSDVVGWIGKPGEAIEGNGAAPAKADTTDKAEKAEKAEKAPRPEPVEAPRPERDARPTPAVTAAPPSPRATGERVKASPLARRIATERGIDLAGIQGSGPAGRIIQRDVESARPAAAAGAPAAAVPAARALVMPPGEAYRDVPLSQIRKTIARRLAQSIGPIPTFYLTTEVDMERVADARDAINATGDAKISYNDIIIKATALALKQHPECNGWWRDDHVRYWNEVHIGMAVAVEDGLITPVIRHADLKSLREISAEARDYAGRARERRLTPEEYTGSTFSVSNLGMFDIDEFTAIINPPEAGILAIGRIADVTVPASEGLEVRKRMKITMSCDHRVIDGATGAKFLRTLKQMLENPLAMVW